MKKLPQHTDFKFTSQEREALFDKWQLSLLASDTYPLTEQESEDLLIAFNEAQTIGQIKKKMKALEQSTQLAKTNDCQDIAAHLSNEFKCRNYLEQLLIDQMAAIHINSMQMLAKAGSGDFHVEEATKLVKSSAKLMDCYQRAMQTLHRTRSAGKQTITVKHQNVQVNGDQAIIADQINTEVLDKNKEGVSEKS